MQWQSATLWNILEKHQECGRNGRGKRSYIHITDTSAQSSIFTSFYIRRRIGLVLQEKRVFLIHLRVARICSLFSLTLLLSRSFLPPFVSSSSSSFRFLPLSQILLNCSRVEPQISVSLSLSNETRIVWYLRYIRAKYPFSQQHLHSFYAEFIVIIRMDKRKVIELKLLYCLNARNEACVCV